MGTEQGEMMDLTFNCIHAPADTMRVVSYPLTDEIELEILPEYYTGHYSVVLDKDRAVRLANEILNHYGEK
jgi:hypothetical protein